jgi:hypothetical protein
MGFKYLLIDSHKANQTTLTAPYKSQIDIRLDHPISNAINVQVMSFSSPNDYFNVRAHADTFDCMLYNLSGVTRSIERKSYKIPVGLYTVTQLVDKLNEVATANPFANMTPVFSLLSTNKVSINASSTGTQIRRFVLFSTSFHNSIIHRLGFSQSQVFTEEFDSKAGDDFFARNTIDSAIADGRLFNTSGTNVFINGRPEAEWYAAIGKPLVWITNGVGETKTGNNIGFESYQHLLLKSSLVGQDFESIYKQADGLVVSRSDNILQKVDTNVSLFSYLHFQAGAVTPFVHTLSGKLIQSFSLELCDDTGQPFGINESKHWSTVLRFEIAEENNQVTRENSLNNQQLRFKASHNCAR